MVSTVGAYYPKGSDEMETIGSGKNDFYETFVFDYAGDDSDGNPILTSVEIDSIRYADSVAAEKGHYEYCKKWLKKKRN